MILVWTKILIISTNLLTWTAVGGQVAEHDIAKLEQQLLEEQLNRPNVPLGSIIRKQLRNLHGHSPRLLAQSQQSEDVLLCDPEDVVLSDFQQWRDESGFWVGNYDFYQSNGSPYTSPQWPFPYRQYRGFITGDTPGNEYRQRNVFVYRPLPIEECGEYDGNITNMFHGTCGMNGNIKLFEANQAVTNCSESADGSISGPYQGVFETKSELIGNDDTVLYQVTLNKDAFGPGMPPNDCLFQSQLTTITHSNDGEQVYRTRSAQAFECVNPATYGQPKSLSFYRERKVDQEELITEMEATIAEFNVTEGDVCAWKTSAASGTAVPSRYYDNPGITSCLLHLNQTFEVKTDSANITEDMGKSVEMVDKTVQIPEAPGMEEPTQQSKAVLQAMVSSTPLLFAQGVAVILLGL
mmetsp:Transcript_25327/g.50447  ORF Transcript_25327/g.50447 Transcript_25327/m.50447 type:complete len:409 (+) Transcript_25327:127-1353(+)